MNDNVIDLASRKRSGREEYQPLNKNQLLEVARKILAVAQHEITAVQTDEQIIALSGLSERDRVIARINSTSQVLKVAGRELIRTGVLPGNKDT